jgi:serine/threonine protein kinase
MPLAPKDLFRLVQQSVSGLTEAEAKPLFVDVLSGLAHMHHHGFVHGDVKMENVLVDEAGHAVLTDFGATYATSSPQQCPRGTKTYAPPETRVLFDACGTSCLEISPGLCVQQQQGPAVMRAQLTSLSCQLRGCDGTDLLRVARHVLPDSQRYDGCKADMWCLGVMLLQMLTAMGMSDVMTILGECPVRLKAAGASEEAAALVLSLMNVDPLRRPSAGELLTSNAWVASVSACAAPAAPASV